MAGAGGRPSGFLPGGPPLSGAVGEAWPGGRRLGRSLLSGVRHPSFGGAGGVCLIAGGGPGGGGGGGENAFGGGGGGGGALGGGGGGGALGGGGGGGGAALGGGGGGAALGGGGGGAVLGGGGGGAAFGGGGATFGGGGAAFGGGGAAFGGGAPFCFSRSRRFFSSSLGGGCACARSNQPERPTATVPAKPANESERSRQLPSPSWRPIVIRCIRVGCGAHGWPSQPMKRRPGGMVPRTISAFFGATRRQDRVVTVPVDWMGSQGHDKGLLPMKKVEILEVLPCGVIDGAAER